MVGGLASQIASSAFRQYQESSAMPNSTFSWTATNGTTLVADWTTNADWNPNTTGSNFQASGAGPTSDFFINLNANLSLFNVGGSGQTVNGLTVNDANATLTMSSGDLTVNNLTLTSGVIVATADSGQISIGTAGAPGTFNIGAGGLIEGGSADGGSGYTVDGDDAAALAAVTGSGTIDATGGDFFFGPNITIAAGQSLSLDIADDGANPANLIFENSVNSGQVNFAGGSGLLVLNGTQVGNGTNLSNGTFGATIAGMTVGSGLTNGIDIADGSDVVSASLNTTTDVLTVTDSHSDTFTFDLVGNYIGASATVAADQTLGGFDVFLVVCYGAGTAILTETGEAAVETIRPGDTVMTLVDGVPTPRTVKWVGHRDFDLSRHPKREAVAPIRVTRGALGDNLPHRDLMLSPDHCLFIDGGLYPAKLLVNDMTIVRDLTATAVSYHHIELDQHAVMIAEGVPAESYLDTGNRAFFSSAGLATVLHPEFNINESLRCWETDACAPLTVKPELVQPVWQRFADRAVAMGYSAPVYETTQDAGIHLVVDGKIVRPLATEGKTITFMVPGKADSVRLVSRATRPSALTPWLDDPRTLGVAIRSVTLRVPSGESVMNADHPSLRDGWHAPEYMADGTFWRWSAGDAVLPFVTTGPCTVEIAVSGTTTYIARETRLAA
jgi:hypothetical protein